jgi:4-hydroxy-4-methyl-2-oxoglutarate aldolase
MDNSNVTSTPRHEPPRSRSARSEIRKRFLGVDTANIADVLDQMGMLDQGLSAEFQPFPATAGKLAGWAYTIRGQMVPYEGTGDAAKMEACHGIGPDEISVWSGDGAGICYFGELIALGMKERGCVGALVDGGVRDVRWLGEHNFAVYACYRTAVQSIGRWRVTGSQEPIYLRGATSERVVVHPGDFVLCDEYGGIVIPARHVMAVLEQSENLTRKEALIREEIARGLTLRQALDKYGHV